MTVQHVDVLVVGAGISGIGAAYHLQVESPNRTYLILEGRSDIGGTWDLFRYPGVRSDSDMHTLSFEFKPWNSDKSIADGPSIMAYLRETIAEFGIDRHIRFGHLVRRAEWSSETATWTVEADLAGGGSATYSCNFLSTCSGYYSYTEGYTPEFAGRERFAGRIVHPQRWPEDLDVTGKRVVVIGSGATAMTLVPALAATAGHVTMLQRSPTYVAAGPDVDVIANGLRRVLPDKLAYGITRKKNTALQQVLYKRMRKNPAKAKDYLVKKVSKALGPD
jgi:cation diffusion facilitator CzcD-associated flavoprotein CzcO